MKNYSEVTATSALVQIERSTVGSATIDGITKHGSTIVHWVSLHSPFMIISDNIKSLSVDNIDITDYIQNDQVNIDRPFYQWLHHATWQGWLLEP